jgi:hypothetical protein
MTYRTTKELSELIHKSKLKKRGVKVSLFAEIDGEVRSLQQWAKDFDLKYYTILKRYKKGITGRELIKPTKT